MNFRRFISNGKKLEESRKDFPPISINFLNPFGGDSLLFINQQILTRILKMKTQFRKIVNFSFIY